MVGCGGGSAVPTDNMLAQKQIAQKKSPQKTQRKNFFQWHRRPRLWKGVARLTLFRQNPCNWSREGV